MHDRRRQKTNALPVMHMSLRLTVGHIVAMAWSSYLTRKECMCSELRGCQYAGGGWMLWKTGHELHQAPVCTEITCRRHLPGILSPTLCNVLAHCRGASIPLGRDALEQESSNNITMNISPHIFASLFPWILAVFCFVSHEIGIDLVRL